MDQRRIEPCRPFGQRGVFRPRAFGHGDQIGHAMQAAISPRRRHPQGQGSGQVDLTGRHHGARPGKDRQALASQKRAVEFRIAFCHHPIDRHPPAGAHAHQIARRHLGNRAHHLGAVDQNHGARHFQCGQFLSRRPSHGTGFLVEIAAQKQEEAEHHGGIEIGVAARFDGLEHRNRRGQNQRQRDREIHVHPAGAQPQPSGFEEGLAGENHRRQRDGAGNPVEQIAGRPLGPRPDGDREEHDVHHREERHAQPHQNVARLPVGLGRRQKAGVQLMRLIADAFQHLDQLGGGHLRLGIHRHPLQRQVDPRTLHPRHRLHRIFDGGNAGRAMRRRQGQHQPRVVGLRQLCQPLGRGGRDAGRAGRGAGGKVGRLRHGGHGVSLPP